MLNQKLRDAIGKLIDDKVAAAVELHELVGTADKLRGQFRCTAADARVSSSRYIAWALKPVESPQLSRMRGTS